MKEKAKYGTEEELALFQEFSQVRSTIFELAEKYSCTPKNHSYVAFRGSVNAIKRKELNGDSSTLEQTASRFDGIIKNLFLMHQGLAYKMKNLAPKYNLDYDTALITAQEKLLDCFIGYDPSLGVRFSTYAYTSIRREYMRQSTADELVHICNDKHIILNKINKEKAKGASEKTAIRRVMRRGGYSQENIELALKVPKLRKVVSLDSLKEDVKYETPDNRLGINPTFDIKEKIASMLETLPENQRAILQLRYGINNVNERAGKPMTLQEVGIMLKLTKERVRQIEKRALETLYGRFSGDFDEN